MAMAWLMVLTGIMAQEVRMLQTDVPQRPVGQRDVLQLTAPPIPTVRVGFIGLGMRGPGAVERFAQIDGTDIKGLCDVEAKRVEEIVALSLIRLVFRSCLRERSLVGHVEQPVPPMVDDAAQEGLAHCLATGSAARLASPCVLARTCPPARALFLTRPLWSSPSCRITTFQGFVHLPIAGHADACTSLFPRCSRGPPHSLTSRVNVRHYRRRSATSSSWRSLTAEGASLMAVSSITSV